MGSPPQRTFHPESKVLELIERIYDAAQDASLWPGVLSQIAAAVEGESIALFAGFPDFRTPDLYATANFPTGAWEAFSAYYATVNPIMERCSTLLPSGKAWLSEHGIPDASLERTEFYNDFFSPYDMHFSLGVKLDFDSSPSAALSCQRSKQFGTFGSEASLLFETLMPHLKRALELHNKLSALEARSLGLEAALDAHDHAVIGLDWEGKVCLSNPLAMDILAAGEGIQVLHGRIRCVHPAEDAVLQNLITCHILGMVTDDSPQGLTISRRERASLLVTMMPIRKALSGRSSPLAGLLFITDSSFASSRATIARRLFGLSPSEARVADLLLQGLEIREISENRKTTLETTRFQVKQLLTKTGTRRQAELLRVLASLPGFTTI